MQEEMKLQDYIRISSIQIWKNKFLISAVTLLFLLMGILYASWQSFTNTYYAYATVYTTIGSTTQESATATTALTSYSDIIKSKKVCERAESIIGEYSVTASDIRSMISASYNKTSTVLTITAYSADPAEAMNVANAVADAFVTEIQAMTGNTMIQVLDKAEDVRMSSNGMAGMLKTIVMAGVIGLGMSILVTIAGVVFSNKIKSVEQCLDEGEEEILGIIPYIE